MSLKISGVINQVRYNTHGDNTNINIVLETDSVDQYNRPQLAEVRLTKNQKTNGFANTFESFVGKRVDLPVWVNAWAGKAGASYTLFLVDCQPKDCLSK